MLMTGKSKIKAFTVVLLFGILLCPFLTNLRHVVAATDSWATSLHDISRTGGSSDTSFSSSQAKLLTKRWSFPTGGPIASQPAMVNGIAYVGSWDGYEYALDMTTGALKWKTFLGVTTGNNTCNPHTAGVSSAATVQNGVVYVGGGDAYWYALNATTGNVLWKVFTGDNSAASGHYNWSSPLIYNGFAYIGVSSLGDCPLVQGQLIKVNLQSHQVVNTLKLVPDGEAGAGIWTSPAYDPATNRIFTVTGTEEADDQQYAQAVLAIDATSMTVVDSWHLPESEAVADSDWTTSTTLYTDANNRKLLLATNKNGNSYALTRSNLAAGPVWHQQIALGSECAACGDSTVSSAALGQGLIYQAGGTPVINGIGYGGSVQAWNRTTGSVIWQHPTAGPVIGALTYMNGMVIDGAGSAVEVLDGTNGNRLYSYDTGPGNLIFAAAAVANGMIITGNTAGTIYAFNLGSVIKPPSDANCPSSFTCQDVGNPKPAGFEKVTNGTWNITTGGASIGGSSDSFRLMSKASAGDVQVIARVTAQQTGSPNAQAGLMLRQSNDPGSAYYSVFVTPINLTVQYRNTAGDTTTIANTLTRGSLPLYLELQRIGDTLQAATSSDGITYTLVPGTTATVIMPYASLAGLATSSGISGTARTASFTNVSIGAISNSPRNTPPASSCPSGWTCSDIGDPLLIGDQTLSGNAWTFKSASTGIDDRSDQLHYVWKTVSGDTTTTIHITGQTNTEEAAKAGLMMRSDSSANSAFYGAFITPGNNITTIYRGTKGLPSDTIATVAGSIPQYLQIARSGNTFTTYTSVDGSDWQPVIGSTQTVTNLDGNILAGAAVTSANSGFNGVTTADLLSITNTAPLPPTNCPSGWTCSDIGTPIPHGSQYLANGVMSILAGGKDIWGTFDEFRYVSQPLAGNGSISSHIASQGDTDPWAKAGVMLRSTADPGAPYYAVLTTPEDNGTVIQYRSVQGGTTTQLAGVSTKAPTYIKIVRAGNTLTGYTSSDGIAWTAIANSTVTLPLSGSALAGLASTSHSQFVTNTTAFDNFSVAASAPNLPAPWADADIGNATPAGSASFANNVFTVSGGGNDIWGTLDQSHYAYQPLAGDGSIITRVTSQSNTNSWAKSGVMIKQSTTAGSTYALLAVTPENGITFQYNYNGSIDGGAYSLPNAWLKLTRIGNTITAYTSSDGVTWTQVGSTTLALSGSVTAGIFVTSHNSGVLNTSTFDDVSVTSGVPNLPAPWADTDIGNPTPAGSASFANNIFTVSGGGNDIWGTIDQLHYAYQSLSADGSITARVTSQSNTDPWAKSGVIIKQSTVAGSPYALLAVSPGNGINFQYGYNSNVSGGSFTLPNTWLRLIRTGSIITAYSSANGTNWTQIGSTDLSSTGPVTIGLFVTSHNSGVLNTSTFDNVSVTQQ